MYKVVAYLKYCYIDENQSERKFLSLSDTQIFKMPLLHCIKSNWSDFIFFNRLHPMVLGLYTPQKQIQGIEDIRQEF